MKEFDVNEFDCIDSEFEEKTGAELYAEFLGKVEKPRDEFVYVYSKYLNTITSLTGSANDLLFWLAMNTDVNTGRVVVQSWAQRDALSELGIAVGTYYKSLNLLKEHDLIRGENAVYFVNPAYIWKGTPDARSRFLRVYPRM